MASKNAKRKAGKKSKTNMWKENRVFLFATVLSSLEGRDKPYTLILETLALKKTANKSILGRYIRIKLIFSLICHYDYCKLLHSMLLYH